MLPWTLAKVEDGPATSCTDTAASRRELRGGRVSTAFPYAKKTYPFRDSGFQVNRIGFRSNLDH
jgi:hypothetical protein